MVVLVIGESLRPDHLGLYGYARETTPRLGALEGLVVFEDVTAPSPVTQTSVAAMMTGAEPETVAEHPEGSWVALAREAGYATAWISNQDRTDGTETALLAEDAEHVVYTSHSWSASAQHDEDVLPEVDRVLARRDGPLALVVHLMGSHDDYSLRYPERFERFGPSTAPPPGREDLDPRERALVDHYDNTALYTDWVVAEVVERVEATGAPAAVVFVSDHGENLFDTPARLRGHGVPGTTPYEVSVPLLAWLSPAMRVARPEVATALARNARQPVAAADLFDAFGHLLGTDWRGVRPERSVFSERYAPRPRRVLTPTGEVVPVEAL